MTKGLCMECEKPVTGTQSAVYQVIGYEKERGGSGGQNHVLRKRRIDGRIWHEPCWDSFTRRLDGRGVQGALL